MKYKKKPVIVEAEQWFPGQNIDGVIYPTSHGLTSPTWQGVAVIQTLEGMMTVKPGDWIITGVKGEKYPCKPDIFEKSYYPTLEEALKDMQMEDIIALADEYIQLMKHVIIENRVISLPYSELSDLEKRWNEVKGDENRNQ